MSQLKGAVVGLGKMGLLHSAIINALDASRLVGVSEPNSLVRSTGQTLNKDVIFYKNHIEMLDEARPDFVFIATPPSSHVSVALDCVKRKIPFFIEKPIAMNAASVEPLLAAIKETPVPNMVGFMLRYMPTFAALHEKLLAESAGTPIYFNASTYVSQMFKKGKGWRFNPGESGGGVLMGQAIHAVDLIVWQFGVPDVVAAHGSAPYSRDVEDFGHVVLQWKSGLQGWIDSSWSVDNHRLLETRLSVTTTTGTYAADDDTYTGFERPLEYGESGNIEIKSRAQLFRGAAVDIGGTHYTQQDEDFILAAREGRFLESDVASAAKVQRVMDAIYHSMANNGTPVNVADMAGLKRAGFWKSLFAVLRGRRF